ncbi:Peptidyl-prolyl cis-trans isomerase cyp8 [Tulasnella sp. 418]|nr:Peptidyl-prolyl cis-trans isomerase cyp8 [Tulasnella sp. 418]
MGQAPSGPKITAQDRAVLDMKLQRDKLKQYQKKIQTILDQEHAIALAALKAGNKTRALTALRRRKYQEGLLQKTDGQLEVLENLVSTVEFALIEKDVMFGLKQGNEVLKQIHAEMSIESVEKLMSETAEAVQYQRVDLPEVPTQEPLQEEPERSQIKETSKRLTTFLHTMGHGANDKLYITHAEHSGALGQHSASSGYRAKPEDIPAFRTPFDCCALSLQPFTHPVCAPNDDGTGVVFDLLNIVPWLKSHNNTHPITGKPLEPSSLISLHYARNANGELHDPVTFKTFTEHSHIVVIRTTGNVFLAESVGKLAGGRDLVADVPFTKADLITLQNPHGTSEPAAPKPAQVAQPSSSKPAPASKPKPAEAAKPTQGLVATTKVAKATLPYNASPYSTGAAGASLTSTSLDPLTKGEMALYDEEELMFDEIAKERKEKDKVKQRAYVRMVTNMGGSLNLELYCEKAPKTCYNFLMLARQGKYDDCPFHRLIPDFMIQGGDPTGTGRGGESYWGTPFRDEYDLKNALKHSERGMLSMANKGKATNGSQFFITFRETPHLDNKHTVFGKLVGGEEILDAMEAVPVQSGTDKPLKPIKITEIVIYQDPFEEYKKRLAKRLEKQAEARGGKAAEKTKSDRIEDKVNWFGEKVGAKDPASGLSTGNMGGVGKYLATATKRAAPPTTAAAESDIGVDAKKKRKLGFGNFDAW